MTRDASRDRLLSAGERSLTLWRPSHYYSRTRPIPDMSRNSLGASRRGPQKYVPYRADDLRQGKRTGIAVAYVQHSSDGFEPFEDVMGQADLRTPPKPKLQRKRKQAKTPVVEEDTDEDDREYRLALIVCAYTEVTIRLQPRCVLCQCPRCYIYCTAPGLTTLGSATEWSLNRTVSLSTLDCGPQ